MLQIRSQLPTARSHIKVTYYQTSAVCHVYAGLLGYMGMSSVPNVHTTGQQQHITCTNAAYTHHQRVLCPTYIACHLGANQCILLTYHAAVQYELAKHCSCNLAISVCSHISLFCDLNTPPRPPRPPHPPPPTKPPPKHLITKKKKPTTTGYHDEADNPQKKTRRPMHSCHHAYDTEYRSLQCFFLLPHACAFHL